MKRVLVVDDELHIRHILRLHLESIGIQVLEAATGREALAVAQRDQPDLVILDLGLPDLSGATVCQRLKALPTLGQVPVIILTALGEEGDACAGATAFITKPFSARDLLALVQRTLGGPDADPCR